MTIPSKVNIERYVLLEEQLRINNINNGPSLYINQTSNENVVDIQQNNSSFFYIENDGNVGIGTNNPNSRLHVNGIITGNGSQITNLNYDNITNQPEIDNVSDTNFDLKLSNKTTTNLIEGSNLYYTNERVEQHILSKNLISLTNSNLNSNELLYYTGDSWCNLKLDETTLEITTDNKLKVIGGTSSGGSGTQVLVQNEITTTVTSNLEKPIVLKTDMSEEREYPPAGQRDFVPTSGTDLSYTKSISHTYGSGDYTIKISSREQEQWNPIETFNEADSTAGIWKYQQYNANTRTYNDSNFNDNGGKFSTFTYKGDWIYIKFPVYINLTKFKFLARTNHLFCAPGDFKIYGSNDETNWIELVSEFISDTDYSSLVYENSVSTTGEYQYFLLMVNKLAGPYHEYGHNLNFDEWYIYGKEDFTTADGLIAHYKFDGDLTDSSGNNHNLSSIGTIEYDESTYIYGKSSYLSGDDHFQTPSSLNPYNIWNGNGITINGWFKLKSNSVDWATLFEINQNGNYRITLAKNYNSNNLWFGKNNNGSFTEERNNSDVFDDTWHHIVITIDVNGNAILYVDNEVEVTLANITLTSAYTNLNISYSASHDDANNVPAWRSIGNIDDFRIYDRVLSAEEVEKLYLEGSDRGLIAYYKFDGNYNDSSDNNNNLLLSGVNDPIFVDNQYLQFQDNIDTSTLTNNVRHGTLKIPSIDLVNKEFTVSIWFKKIGTLIQSGILILGEDERVSDTGHFEIYTKPNEVKANYRTDSGQVVWDAIVINPVLNQWHNIVLVVSDTSIKGYLDNVLVKTTSISNKLPDGIYDTNYLGCMNNSTSISTSDKYLIDDFRIYDRALSAAEVEKLYNSQYIQKREITDSTDEYIIFKYNPNTVTPNNIYNVIYDVLPNTWYEMETIAIQNGGRLPTKTEMDNYVTGVNNGTITNKIHLQYAADAAQHSVWFAVAETGLSGYTSTIRPFYRILDSSGTLSGGLHSSGANPGEVNDGDNNIFKWIWYIREQTEYTINFSEETECEILLLDDTNYNHLETPLEPLTGTYTIKVGVSESSISNSTYNKTTSGGTSISSGYSTDITGTNKIYSSKEVIIRYATTKEYTVTTTSGSNPILSSLSSLTPELNSLLYFNTSNSINYLELDPTTLEITTDNKLKVIGGGGGTQVLIQNESDTITSNLEKPIIDNNSNLVTDGLIAHYKFDDDLTDATDPTNSSKNLTSSTAVTYNSDSIYGKSSYLYSNNYLTAPFKLKYLTDIGNFSISFWFKTDPTKLPKDTWNVLWSSSNYAASGADNRGLRLYLHSDNSFRLYTYQDGGGGNNYTYNNSISNSDTWVFLTTEFTYVSTSGNNINYTFKLYLDNVLISNTGGSNNQSITFKTNDTEYFTIMDDDDNNYPNEVYLDDFRIYDRALSAAEVEKLYLEGSDRGLIAHYKFDNDLTDSSGNNNHLEAVVGGHTYPDGVYDEAVLFASNNTTQLRTINNFQQITHNTSFSVSTWVKLTSTNKHFIFAWGDAYTNNASIGLTVESSGKIQNYIWGATALETTNTFTDTTKYYFIVLTRTAGSQKIYVDGVLEDSFTNTDTLDTGTTKLHIGYASPSWANSANYLDDFRIYDRVLSAEEVEKLYNDQYIQKGQITGSTDEYIAFKYNPATAVSDQTEYTINFPQETECEILLLDDTNYKHLETPLESLNGTYTVKVGTTESSISNSTYNKTSSSGTLISSGYSTDITGTTQTYSSKEVIIKYKTQIVTTVTRIDPKLSSLSSLTPELNSLLYFNTSNSINYLELDPTTLEITTDNKLKVIGGGGGGTQVLIQNESDTITSNLEKPIIDNNSNLVTDGLIAHYKFDDSTNIGLDSSVGGIGDATPSDSSVTATTAQKVIGVSGAVIAQERLDLPNITFGSSNTISFWIKLDMTPVADDTWNKIFDFSNSDGHRIILERDGNAPKEDWFFYFQSSVGSYNQHTISNVLENNVWYHIVISWNTTNVNMYFNNVLKVNNQSSSHFRYSFAYTHNRIGKSTDDQINGYLDDFRIYDRALSAAEIENLYNAQYITKSLITDSTDEVVSFKYNENNNNGSDQSEYTINFPQATECEILLLDDTNYKHLETPLESLNGTYTVKVGVSESSISKSGYIKTTSGEVRTPELLSISGYASWDNHKAHAETNNGRLPYRDEIINLLNGDTSLNDQINPNVDSYKDVWIPVNDYIGAFIEIGDYPSHGTYTLKTPNGGEQYYENGVLTTATSLNTTSSTIMNDGSSWVPNTNIFYVPYYSTDITGTTQTYSSKEVIIRYKTQIVTTVTTIDPILSSLSSLTPELNSLLYFNTSNSINYLELDPTTLEITSNNQLSVIGGSTSSGVDGIDGTSTTILEISKHIIPDTNATYDIGSAEKKIRHLFLSDNSLWIGDDNKFSISEGKMRIMKRKRNIIPSKLLELEPTINETKILNLSEKQSLNDLNLSDWEKYVKENYPESKLFGSDLFQNKNDYELNATTDAWVETTDKNILISGYYSNIGIGEIEPKYKLDVKGDINLTGKLYKNGIDYDSNIVLFEKQNLSNNDILYYNNGNWSNLKLDENSLEISNDNKLKLIDSLLNKITELENRISVLENP